MQRGHGIKIVILYSTVILKEKKRWTNFTLHIYFFNERISCNYIERENMVRSCLEACVRRRYSLKTVSCENIKINVINFMALFKK